MARRKVADAAEHGTSAALVAAAAPCAAAAGVGVSTDERGTREDDAGPEARSPGGIPIRFRIGRPPSDRVTTDPGRLALHLDLARFKLLRGFDELLCLEGLQGIDHLPHQIETVRKVLRHFRGRVLLADEVGLGKTIESCLLLREYLLRGLARRVLILVPAPLVSQWDEELRGKFGLEFAVAGRGTAPDDAGFWSGTDRVLASLSYAKAKKRAEHVAAAAWDLVIVDEAHHCRNRSTRNWQLVNSLQRRHMFLLTATPVQNDLVELFNLLTLLEPGHLRTEQDFRKQFVKRGNPRDPRNRERLRSLLGEVMIRNTRSLVQMDLPPRYAQTLPARPQGDEVELHRRLSDFLRRLAPKRPGEAPPEPETDESGGTHEAGGTSGSNGAGGHDAAPPISAAPGPSTAGDTQAGSWTTCATEAGSVAPIVAETAGAVRPPLTRMQLSALLSALGSHPAAIAQALERIAEKDAEAAAIRTLAAKVDRSAKDARLLELLRQSQGHKALVFVNFRQTLHRLQGLLTEAGIAHATYSGEQSQAEKDAAVAALRDDVPVMLCTDSGGEGRNLQFADTLVNYDLPWNPMKIEQRIGRVHRIGQTRDVFVFNLCTTGSLEDRILRLLDEKIRMFELVVGEVGSILGNLDGGEEFETLVLDLWQRSGDDAELDRTFDDLGERLLAAQAEYVQAKELDEALFGEDYE